MYWVIPSPHDCAPSQNLFFLLTFLPSPQQATFSPKNFYCHLVLPTAIPTFWLLFFFTLGQCDLPLFSLVPFYQALAHRTIQFIRHSFLLHCFHLSSIRTCDRPLAITLALPTPRTLSTSLLCLPSRPAALTKLTCTCESKVLLLLCVLVLLVSRFLPHPAFQNTLPQFQHASACSVPVYPLLLPFPPGLDLGHPTGYDVPPSSSPCPFQSLSHTCYSCTLSRPPRGAQQRFSDPCEMSPLLWVPPAPPPFLSTFASRDWSPCT